MVGFVRIIEYPELEGTHEDHRNQLHTESYGRVLPKSNLNSASSLP